MSKNKAPLLILFLTIFIDLLGFGLVIPVLPNHIKELTGNEYLVGIAIAIFSVMQFLASPILGSLSDKFGRRPLLIITIILNIFGYGLLAVSANSIILILIARAISGIASGNISLAQSYIIDITPPEKRSKSMGLIGAAFGLGFIFGPPIGGYLMAEHGFISVGTFASAVCFLNLIPAIFLLKESIKEKNPLANIRLLPISEYNTVLRRPGIGKIFMVYFVYTVAFSLFYTCSALFWEDHFGLDEAQRGYAYAFLGLSTAIVQGGMIGMMAKRFGDKKLLIGGNIAMAFILAALGIVPADMFLAIEIPLIFLMAIANGPVNPSALSLLSLKLDAKEQGKVVGLYQSFGSLARSVGPLLGTALYAQNYVIPFIAAGIILIGNAVFSKITVGYWKTEPVRSKSS